jgi:hypothetical protein
MLNHRVTAPVATDELHKHGSALDQAPYMNSTSQSQHLGQDMSACFQVTNSNAWGHCHRNTYGPRHVVDLGTMDTRPHGAASACNVDDKPTESLCNAWFRPDFASSFKSDGHTRAREAQPAMARLESAQKDVFAYMIIHFDI